MSLELKKAELSDIPLLNKIILESKMHWDYPEDWIANWKAELTLTDKHLAKNKVYKLLDKELILGLCSISENPDNYEIEHLWLKPEFIGMGYGRFLLNESLKRAGAVYKKIIVISDPNSESFYKRQGFVTVGEVESYPEGRFIAVNGET